jgi:hypothetical protein
VCVGVCVCARARRIILSSAPFLALPYFSTLSHEQLDFGNDVSEHKMCFNFL